MRFEKVNELPIKSPKGKSETKQLIDEFDKANIPYAKVVGIPADGIEKGRLFARLRNDTYTRSGIRGRIINGEFYLINVKLNSNSESTF